MALTLTEQQDLLSGIYKPPSITLNQMLNLAVMNYALNFRENYTVFATVDGNGDPINTDAQSYLSRMLRVCNRVVRQDTRQQVVSSFEQVMVSEIATTAAVTTTLLQNATDANWEQFVNTNILSAFEIVGGVLKAEKTAYDAL